MFIGERVELLRIYLSTWFFEDVYPIFKRRLVASIAHSMGLSVCPSVFKKNLAGSCLQNISSLTNKETNIVKIVKLPAF